MNRRVSFCDEHFNRRKKKLHAKAPINSTDLIPRCGEFKFSISNFETRHKWLTAKAQKIFVIWNSIINHVHVKAWQHVLYGELIVINQPTIASLRTILTSKCLAKEFIKQAICKLCRTLLQISLAAKCRTLIYTIKWTKVRLKKLIGYRIF